MNDAVALLLAVWALGLVVTLVMGGSCVGFGTESDKRYGARIVLLSPAWPVLLGVGIVYCIRYMWRMSGWSRE